MTRAAEKARAAQILEDELFLAKTRLERVSLFYQIASQTLYNMQKLATSTEKGFSLESKLLMVMGYASEAAMLVDTIGDYALEAESAIESAMLPEKTIA